MVIFLSNEKKEKHMQTIEALTLMAIENNDFKLAEAGIDLMGDVFGLQGLYFGKTMCEKRIAELQDKLRR